MNQALEAIYKRRSIRKYKPEQISREELDAVLKAGVCAPTGMNRQSPIILVLQDKEQIAYLSRLARPDIAVITNIGTSHLEYLGTRENIRDIRRKRPR